MENLVAVRMLLDKALEDRKTLKKEEIELLTRKAELQRRIKALKAQLTATGGD